MASRRATESDPGYTKSAALSWCDGVFAAWKARMKAANRYWGRHVGRSRGSNTSRIETRIDAFLSVLGGLSRTGWKPAVVNIVDSSPAQPWLMSSQREGDLDHYEHRQVGGPYTPPEIAAYVHQRLVKGIKKIYGSGEKMQKKA